MSNSISAQTTYTIDESESRKYVKPDARVVEVKKEDSESEEESSFVNMLGKLGNGLVNKLKRRFNLDEIKNKVENTKDKVKGTFKNKDDQESEDQEETPPEQ